MRASRPSTRPNSDKSAVWKSRDRRLHLLRMDFLGALECTSLGLTFSYKKQALTEFQRNTFWEKFPAPSPCTPLSQGRSHKPSPSFLPQKPNSKDRSLFSCQIRISTKVPGPGAGSCDRSLGREQGRRGAIPLRPQKPSGSQGAGLYGVALLRRSSTSLRSLSHRPFPETPDAFSLIQSASRYFRV